MTADQLTALFREHHVALHRYLTRLGGDSDLAADAAQEAFVRLIERGDRMRDDAPRAWLFTVATRIVLDGARTSARRLRLLDRASERVPAASPTPDAQARLEGEERRRVVADALARLSAKERTALLMQQEGFAHREIASAIGTTTGSVGTLLARSLDKLATALPLDADTL